MEKKMPTSDTKKFEKASLGEGSNGVVGTPTTKEQGCSGLMKNISKLRGEILPLTETIDWIDMNKKMRNLFHQEDK